MNNVMVPKFTYEIQEIDGEKVSVCTRTWHTLDEINSMKGKENGGI